jgi:1-acyl-sn-glycerol-3-phosphate acyltransferase
VHITAIVREIAHKAYGVYAWTVLLIVVAPVVVALALVPGLFRRRRIARRGARAVFGLIGSRVDVHGAENCRTSRAVVVANHSSYLDGMILTAALPARFTYLIKEEMSAVPIAGFILRRLGSEFVDRTNAPRRHKSARRLMEATRGGAALALFPEGTFDAAPGLRHFHPGAFRAAWRAGVHIVPVTIQGARAKLPAGCWLPRPGPLTVRIGAPLDAPDYASAAALMQASRRAILDQLAEPDLSAPAKTPRPAHESVT